MPSSSPPPVRDLASARAATGPVVVPPRQPTQQWSGAVATGPGEQAVDATSPAGDGRRRAPSWLVAALVSAVVSGGVVATALTVGPLDDGASPASSGAAAKAPATTRPDTGWQPLAVSGGFIPTGDGARYRVVDGICYLQVHVRDPDGLWAPYSPIAMLPESALPAWNHGFVAVRDGVPYSEVGVYDDGQVLMTRAGDGVAGWLSFSASFPVGD